MQREMFFSFKSSLTIIECRVLLSRIGFCEIWMDSMTSLTIHAKSCVCVCVLSARACACFFGEREYIAFLEIFQKICIETKGKPSVCICLEAVWSSRAELHRGLERFVP